MKPVTPTQLPKPAPESDAPRATVMFNGSLYQGELVRATEKRLLVRFTTPTGRTRENWFAKVDKPRGVLVSRRAMGEPGSVTMPPNSAFLNGAAGASDADGSARS